MGLIAFDKSQVTPFSLSFDTEEPKTVFMIGALGIREMNYITLESGGLAAALGGKPDVLAGGPLLALRLGILGWENLRNSSGELVEPKKEKLRIGPSERDVLTEESVVENIRSEWVRELVGAIMQTNAVQGEHRKN